MHISESVRSLSRLYLQSHLYQSGKHARCDLGVSRVHPLEVPLDDVSPQMDRKTVCRVIGVSARSV